MRILVRRRLTENETAIDAMRGFAAILVLLSHADAYGLIPIVFTTHAKIITGETGVDLFFMLSGYLIWVSAERTLPKPGGLWTYFIHRATRIAPLYYVALALVLFAAPLFVGSFHPSTTMSGVVRRHIFFAQSIAPPVSDQINPVLWTLTHEAIYYALVPILWFARRRPLWLLLPASIAISVLAWHVWLGALTLFLRVAFMFAIGFTIARYEIGASWVLAAVGAVACVLIRNQSPFLVSPVLAFTCLMLFSKVTVAWPLKPFAWAGVISYSLYIWNYILVEWVGPALIYTDPVTRAAIFIIVVFGFSSLTYFVIERPSMTVLRRFLVRHRPPLPSSLAVWGRAER